MPAVANWLGDWFTIRLDDSTVFRTILEPRIRGQMDPRGVNWNEEMGLFFQMPLTLGVEVRNPLVFAGVLAAAKKAIDDVLPGSIDWEPIQPAYKGVTMVQIKAKGDIARMRGGQGAGLRADLRPGGRRLPHQPARGADQGPDRPQRGQA